MAASSPFNRRWQTVALNPQPLPPGPDDYRVASKLSLVSLNPQPLPPMPSASMYRRIGTR